MRIRRIVVTGFLTCLAAASASGQEYLQCIETEARGFTWQDEEAGAATFEPDRFGIEIVSPTERKLIHPALPEAASLICQQFTRDPETFSCYGFSGAMTYVFRGDQFTRAALYGTNVGGDPDIVIAYGSCTTPQTDTQGKRPAAPDREQGDSSSPIFPQDPDAIQDPPLDQGAPVDQGAVEKLDPDTAPGSAVDRGTDTESGADTEQGIVAERGTAADKGTDAEQGVVAEQGADAEQGASVDEADSSDAETSSDGAIAVQ